jgi:hypothetical protein
VDKAKLGETLNELAYLRGVVTKLRETNAKLLQQTNMEGMHTLVRENTQLKKSIIHHIQKQRNNSTITSQSSALPWGNQSADLGEKSSALPELGSSITTSSVPTAAADDIIALRTENARLRAVNEQLVRGFFFCFFFFCLCMPWTRFADTLHRDSVDDV